MHWPNYKTIFQIKKYSKVVLKLAEEQNGSADSFLNHTVVTDRLALWRCPIRPLVVKLEQELA